MRLVTFEDLTSAQKSRGAILVAPDTLIDLAKGFAWLEDQRGTKLGDAELEAKHGRGVLGFVEQEKVARPAADALVSAFQKNELPEGVRLPLAGKKLLAPIPRPPSMRDGYAFRQHVLTARKNRGLDMIPEFDQFPVFYFTNHQAVIGGGELRVRDLHLDRLDFELEAAIVVGREGRDLTSATADEHVFGLMIMNDWSARALQMEEMKLSLGPAKGKDFATGLGPWLVTKDELAAHTTRTPRGDVYDLGMRAFVNEKQLSAGNVKDMNWTFAEIMARASYGVTLHPGDVIGSGTVGTGCLLELNGSKITDNQWLKPQDSVVLEIDGLGRLENTVVRAEP
jgi:fumarylacetoacetate (FAA) hydrolase